MKHITQYACLLLMMISITCWADMQQPTQAERHVLWTHRPISITLPVGHERMITFPEPIVVHNTNSKLTHDKIAIVNNAGTLYLRAKKAFSTIRILVALPKSGVVVLVDLSAQSKADATPLAVVLTDQHQHTLTSINGQHKSVDQSPATVHYATLMRYAISHLYSPMRLLEENPSVVREPMYTQKSVALVKLPIIAMPLISWRDGDLYVTAILLKNFSQHTIVIDPKSIRGRWLACSLYPSKHLTSAGSAHDRSTLFVISRSPFNRALLQLKDYQI